MFNDLDFFHPGFTRNLLQVGGWLECQFQMLKYKKQTTTGTCVAFGRCYSLAVDVFFCMGVGVFITVWKAEHTVTQKQRFLKSSCLFHDVAVSSSRNVVPNVFGVFFDSEHVDTRCTI